MSDELNRLADAVEKLKESLEHLRDLEVRLEDIKDQMKDLEEDIKYGCAGLSDNLAEIAECEDNNDEIRKVATTLADEVNQIEEAMI